MHVPYSMDDNEPDLYGSLGSDWLSADNQFPQEDNDPYPHSTKYNLVLERIEIPKWYTQEQVDKLNNEIAELKGLLSYIYNHSERLPYGCSQQIREALTK